MVLTLGAHLARRDPPGWVKAHSDGRQGSGLGGMLRLVEHGCASQARVRRMANRPPGGRSGAKVG